MLQKHSFRFMTIQAFKEWAEQRGERAKEKAEKIASKDGAETSGNASVEIDVSDKENRDEQYGKQHTMKLVCGILSLVRAQTGLHAYTLQEMRASDLTCPPR